MQVCANKFISLFNVYLTTTMTTKTTRFEWSCIGCLCCRLFFWNSLLFYFSVFVRHWASQSPYRCEPHCPPVRRINGRPSPHVFTNLPSTLQCFIIIDYQWVRLKHCVVEVSAILHFCGVGAICRGQDARPPWAKHWETTKKTSY